MPIARPLATTCASIAASVLFFGAALAVEDWPKWLGPRGDNISKEEIAAAWPADGPKKLWSIDVGEGHSSPVAVAGRIYLFTLGEGEEILTCLDAKTGKEIWAEAYPLKGKVQYPGARATPTVEGERIYTLGELGDLVCRELADGREVWKINVLKETGTKQLQWGSASAPLVRGERIYVQTGDGGPIAVAVNKGTGKVEWKSEEVGKAGYAALVYADMKDKPQLLIFGGRSVGGLDPETGKTLWSEKFETRYDVNAATPLFFAGKALFTAEYDTGRAAMYDVTGGTGKKLWETKNLKSKFQPPILENGFIYGNSGGTVVCLKWESGEVVWQANEKNLRLGPGGSLLRAGDKLIALSERGRLSLLQATPEKYAMLAQYDLFDADQVWASPLLYDGKLYCKSRDEFVCLDVAAK